MVVHGTAFPLTRQGGKKDAIPFFKVSDMNRPGNEEELTRAENYVDEGTARLLGAKICPPGTVVFPKVGGALLTNKKRVLGVTGTFDNNVMGLVPNTSVIDPDWLRLWFERIDIAKFANTQALP